MVRKVFREILRSQFKIITVDHAADNKNIIGLRYVSDIINIEGKLKVALKMLCRTYPGYVLSVNSADRLIYLYPIYLKVIFPENYVKVI